MNEEAMQSLLRNLEAAYEAGDTSVETVNKLRSLSRSRYGPALPFLLRLLDAEEYVWRSQSLSLVGFDYDLKDNPDALEKIRHVLLHDTSFMNRMKAAASLGVQSSWPDKALDQAFETDAEYAVRIAVFRAILTLVDVPESIIEAEIEQLEAEEITPTWADTERITAAVAAEMKRKRTGSD